MHIVAEIPGAKDPEIQAALKSRDMYDKYRDAARLAERYRYYAQTHMFLADSFPNISLDFGPGSLAAYLGSDIKFRPDTIWFTECVDAWEGYPELTFNPENHWYKEHLQLSRDVKKLAGDDYYLLTCAQDSMQKTGIMTDAEGRCENDDS